MKNWWYYHKWYVICGALLLFIFVERIGNALGWFQKSPDIQIAYVGEAPLPEDTVIALEKAFSSFAGDYNQDGEILVQVHQFAGGNPENADAETTQYRQASEIALIGDINDCESYFFLMEHPEDFQKNFQILAMPDGSCPDVSDLSAEDKIFQWNSCSLLWFFRNCPYYPFDKISFAANNSLPQRPYMVRFIIFNLLFVPSTKPFDKGLATAFSMADKSFSSPEAKRESSFKALFLYFSINRYKHGMFFF